MLEKLKQEAERLKAEAEAETKRQQEEETAGDEQMEQQSEEDLAEEEEKKVSPAKRKAPIKKAAKPKTPSKIAAVVAKSKLRDLPVEPMVVISDDEDDMAVSGKAADNTGQDVIVKNEKVQKKKTKEEPADHKGADHKPSKGKKMMVS